MKKQNSLKSTIPKAFIFDMDGVIIDSDTIISNGIQQYGDELGIEITNDFVMNHLGGNSYRFWDIVKKKFNLSYDIEFLVSNARKKYIDFFKNDPSLKPVDGVCELIRSIKEKGFPIVLATSGSEKRMNIILKRFNLTDEFMFRFSSKDVKKGKPDPEIFTLAANRLNVHPKDCLVIEDSSNGVEAAIRADMKCIGYKNNSSNQSLEKAHYILSSFVNIDCDYLLNVWESIHN